MLDTTVPLATAVGAEPTRLLGVWEGSAAEQAAALVATGIAVVSGLHSVSAARLADLDHELEEDTLLCGDSPRAKQRVVALIETTSGLRPVDAGPLGFSRVTESLTPLLVSLNRRHSTTAGIRVTRLS